MKAYIVRKAYPNKQYSYGVFSLGGVEIGRANFRHGMWVLPHCRKLLSDEQAMIEILQRTISRLNRVIKQSTAEISDARSMLRQMRLLDRQRKGLKCRT